MSLVGTRPILQDELRQYELHHRFTVLYVVLPFQILPVSII